MSHREPARARGDEFQIPSPHTILCRHGKLSVEAIRNGWRLVLAHLHGADIAPSAQRQDPAISPSRATRWRPDAHCPITITLSLHCTPEGVALIAWTYHGLF
jgi:hypothetical protein